MTIPEATYRYGNQCAVPQTRPSYGGIDHDTPEAAAAIERVRLTNLASSGKNYNRSAFGIKPPKPAPEPEPIPEGTRMCKRGHPQKPKNRRMRSDGKTVCKVCDRERKTPREDQT